MESVGKYAAFLLLALVIWLALRGASVTAIAAMLVICGLHFWQVEDSHDNIRGIGHLIQRDVPTLAFLAVMIWVYRLMSSKSRNRMALAVSAFLASFIVFGALSYSIDRAVYLIVAFALLSPALYAAFFRESEMRAAYAIFSAIGALTGLGLTMRLLRGGMPELIRFGLLTQPKTFDLYCGYPYDLDHLPSFLILMLMAANTYWIVSKLLRKLAVAQGKRAGFLAFTQRYFIELCLWLVALLVFRSPLGRADWPHVSIAAVFTLLLSVVIIFGHTRLSFYRKTSLAVSANCVVILLAVGASAYGIYAVRNGSALRRDFPLAVSDATFIPPQYKATAEFLRDNLRKDETIYTLTGEPLWYYLLDKPCPSRFYITAMASANFFQREVINDLRSKNVRFIIRSNACWANRMDGISVQDRVPAIWSYVDKNYRFLTFIDDCELWERKTAVRRQYRYTPAVHCGMGMGLLYLSKPADAIEEFKKALSMDPSCPNAHSGITVAYYLNSDYTNAWRELRRAREQGDPIPPGLADELSARVQELK